MQFRVSWQRNDATYFFSCNKLLAKEKSINFSTFFEKIGEISDEFNDRFADFDLLKANVELFNNLMKIDTESQPPYPQQELCELQSDFFSCQKK